MSETAQPIYIPLVRLAEEMGYNPAVMKRSLARSGIESLRIRINGRPVYAVTTADAEKYKERKSTPGVLVRPSQAPSIGGVYLLRSDPELRPNRLKVGWTDNFSARIAMHRCVAPGLEVLCMWATSVEWTERMAIGLLRNLASAVAVSGEIFDVTDHREALDVLEACFRGQGIMRVENQVL